MLGVQRAPVRSDEAATEARNTLFLFLPISLTTNATEEVGTSTMTSTFSLSVQRLAMFAPTSGLFWWSPATTSILLPLWAACAATQSAAACRAPNADLGPFGAA